MGRLIGKVAIVVGSATGIGAATARKMAREGAKVVLADVNVSGATAVASEICAGGGEAFACATDIADEAAVKAMVAQTVDRYGGIDILHNNAAALVPEVSGVDATTDALNLDLAVWDRTMAVNVRGFLLTMKYVVPEMLKRGGGSIINTSSINGLAGQETHGAYGTSKAAVIGLTQHIATAYGKRGIRCNAIAPGAVPSPHQDWHGREGTYLRHLLSPRLGRPEDLANAVAFLASDEAAYITGQVIAVDGGTLAHLPSYADFSRG